MNESSETNQVTEYDPVQATDYTDTYTNTYTDPDTNTNYDTSKAIILVLLSLFILIVFIRQLYFKRINFTLVSTIIFLYSLIYFIFLSVTTDIIFHFHHALTAGFLSLFFTDFQSKFD